MSWRRLTVLAAFVAAIGAVLALNGRAAGSIAARASIALSEVAHASGIDFVHQETTLDPKIANIAAQLGALGSCVSVADFNNDNWPDLYFTTSRFGAANALYVNQHDGTFRDVAVDAGVASLNRPGDGVSMGAVWGDYDNDGNEDLFVYKWGYPQLLHNLGDGRFEDVTEQSGLRRWMNSNGAVWFDFDRDGLLDLYVTGYFRSDIDFWHLKTTRIMQESWDFASNGGKNLLFKNMGNGTFKDVTDSLGVGSTRWTLAAAAADADAGWAWGAQFGDLNNDGLLDLVVTNGFISADTGRDYWYAMSKIAGAQGNIFEDAKNWPPIGNASLSGYERSRVLLNRGRDGFVDVADAAGITDRLDGRSVALADLFNRGTLDVVIANERGRALLYRNTLANGHWVELRLIGTRSNHSAIGAEVTAEFGGAKQRQVVSGGTGFCSQNDRRLHFGLGPNHLGRVTIRWPSGTVQTLDDLTIDQLHVITEPAR